MRRYRATDEGREKHRTQERERGRANPEANRRRATEWHWENRERALRANRAATKRRLICPVVRQWEMVRQQDWRKRNPSKSVASANRRRTAKIGATPKWLTPIQRAQIEQFYEVAVALRVQTGLRWDVDHIHPLRGDGVCGLHVPWNLQVLPKSVNSAKGNKLTPDLQEAA